jgi:hypothetical protein
MLVPSESNPLDFRLLFDSGPGLCLVLTPLFRILEASDAFLRATLTTREQIIGFEIFEVLTDSSTDGATNVSLLRTSLERTLQSKSPDTMAVRRFGIRCPASASVEERFWSQTNFPTLDSRTEVVLHHSSHRRCNGIRSLTEHQPGGGEDERSAPGPAGQLAVGAHQQAQELTEANLQLRTANTKLAHLYEQIALLSAQADTELWLSEPSQEAADALPRILPEDMLTRLGKLIAGHKLLEEELRQSQRMDAIGRLAGGIAHDFNNILGVIIGYANLLLVQLEPQHPMYRRLEEIRSAGGRAANLTRQLLAFSRRQILEPRVVNLASTLEEMDRMLRRLLVEDIEVVTGIDKNLAQVKIDPTQVQQVIMNLVVNARDAMPRGGKLTLELWNVELSERHIPHYGVAPGSLREAGRHRQWDGYERRGVAAGV